MVLGWVFVTAAMAVVLFLFVVYFNYRKTNVAYTGGEKQEEQHELKVDINHTNSMQQFEIDATNVHHESQSYELEEHHDDRYEDSYV